MQPLAITAELLGKINVVEKLFPEGDVPAGQFFEIDKSQIARIHDVTYSAGNGDELKGLFVFTKGLVEHPVIIGHLEMTDDVYAKIGDAAIDDLVDIPNITININGTETTCYPECQFIPLQRKTVSGDAIIVLIVFIAGINIPCTELKSEQRLELLSNKTVTSEFSHLKAIGAGEGFIYLTEEQEVVFNTNGGFSVNAQPVIEAYLETLEISATNLN